MSTVNIMHMLLDKKDEESLECLCKLLTTVGKDLENDNVSLEPIFKGMRDVVEQRTIKVSSRVKLMLQDVLDLRSANWMPQKHDVNPKIQREVDTNENATFSATSKDAVPKTITRSDVESLVKNKPPPKVWAAPLAKLLASSLEDKSPNKPLVQVKNEAKAKETNAENLKYEDGQCSPFNRDGKKVYNKEFLFSLREAPASKVKPNDIYDVISSDDRSQKGGVIPKRIPTKEPKKKSKNKKDAKLYNKARDVLFKLTPQNLDTFSTQMRLLEIGNDKHLQQDVIDLVFNKVVDLVEHEPNYSDICDRICKELALIRVPTEDSTPEAPKSVSFRKLLVTRCQMEFENQYVNECTLYYARQVGVRVIEATTDPDKKKDLQLRLEEHDKKLRMKRVSNVRFFGELFKQKMFTADIMLRCLNKLFANKGEENLECLCKLLTTVGKDLEDENMSLETIFEVMRDIVERRTIKVSSRVKFMLQEVIDLRAAKWVPQRQDVKPKIQKEAQDEQTNIKSTLLQSQPPQRANGIAVSSPTPSLSQQPNQGAGLMVGIAPTGPPNQPSTPPNTDIKVLSLEQPNKGDNQGAGLRKDTSPTGSPKQASTPLPSLQQPNQGGNQGPGLQAGIAYVRTTKQNQSPPNQPERMQNQHNMPPQPQMYTQPQNVGYMAGIPPQMYLTSPAFYDSGGQRQQNLLQPLMHPLMHPQAFAPTNYASPPATYSNFMASPQQRPSSAPPNPAQSAGGAFLHGAPLQAQGQMNCFRTPMRDPDTAGSGGGPPANQPHRQLQQQQPLSKDMQSNNYMPKFINNYICNALKTSRPARVKSGELLANLIKLDTVSLEDFCTGLQETFDIADDMLNDIPTFWQYLAEILHSLICMEVLPFTRLHRMLEGLGHDHHYRFVGTLLSTVAEVKGQGFLRSVWQVSLLRITDVTGGKDSEFFVRDFKLEFLNDATNDQIQAKLTEFFINKSNVEEISRWIDANVGDRVKEDKFIRALVTAILKDSIKKDFLSVEIFHRHLVLLQKYIDNNFDSELQSLYAMQSLVNEMEHPKGLLLSIVNHLYESFAISLEGFLAWEASSDPAEQAGKGEAMKQLNQFLTELKETRKTRIRTARQPNKTK